MAAGTNRDTATVCLNLSIQGTISSTNTGSVEHPIMEGASGFDLMRELYASTFFQHYSAMYDQVKLNSARVKIMGTIQGQNASQFISPSVSTAWDRNGVNYAEGATWPSNSEIRTYGSCITKPWSLGNAFQMTRYISASSMAEKSAYMSTKFNPQAVENQAYPWNPCFLVGVQVPSITMTNDYLFTFDVDVVVTFRGLRKAEINEPGKQNGPSLQSTTNLSAV